MELNDRDLSAAEQRLADELANLTQDPGAGRRAKILAAVRNVPDARRRPVHRWRIAIAAAAAAALLVVTSVGALAASADALPSNPNYQLRSFGEQVRLTFADPTTREQLRMSFAQSRISQARMVLQHGDRTDARGLLRDSRHYIAETKQDLAGLPSGEQGQIENQLNQTQTDQNQAESQLNQQGAQGQEGQ
jgi:hypothetical protein